MSVLSLSYWESDVYWRQNNKHFAELALQNGAKQLIWRNYITVTLCIASDLSKVANFNLPHLHLEPPLGMTPFEFCRELHHQKTRIPGLSCGVVYVILYLAVLVSRTATCDRQTHDYGICRASMASRVKKIIKIHFMFRSVSRCISAMI